MPELSTFDWEGNYFYASTDGKSNQTLVQHLLAILVQRFKLIQKTTQVLREQRRNINIVNHVLLYLLTCNTSCMYIHSVR